MLYEGQGIRLYEEITHDPQYYLYRDELSVFQKYADDIVRIRVDIAIISGRSNADFLGNDIIWLAGRGNN